ncbi:MAG: hypothetical protein WDZ94_04305 [Patescibacteria group bacterium]
MTFKPALLTLATCTTLIAAGSSLSFAQTEQPLEEVVSPTAPVVQQEVAEQELTTQAAIQNQLSLTAIPTRLGDDLSIALDPGETEQVMLRVINTGDESVTIRSTPQDFVVFDDAQTPTPINLDDADNRWSLASWLTITPSTQTLQPGEMASLQAVISVPEDALAGGHYAMVIHQPDMSGGTQNADGTQNTQASAVEQRVGTLLYVMVNGLINEEAVIREFTLPEFSEFGPVPYSFAVENLSDIHIQPRITVEIHNMFGQRVESMQLDSKNIFPFTAREFEGQWDRIWGFGLYTAEVTMSYGSEGSVVSMSEQFWLLPITIIVAIIIVVLTLIASWIAIRRHIIHRRQDQSKRIQELESKLEKIQSDKLDEFEN